MANTDVWAHLQDIANQGNYSVAAKLPKPKVTPTTYTNVNLPGYSGTNYASTGGNTSLDSLMAAIRSKESSGRYGVVNPDSGAAGAYQMMPGNVTNWSRSVLGRSVSMNEFLKSPQIQDQIARYQLGQYLKKYGAAGAAVAWYGGEGSVKNMYSKTTQKGGYPSLYAYWQSVLSKM